MIDIMIDLETIDTKRSAAILALAAVQFDPFSNKKGETFYKLIDLDSSLEAGCTLSGETFLWWLQQSDFARKAITEPTKIDCTKLCVDFSKYLQNLGNPNNFRIWGNGMDFDVAILCHLYDLLKIKFPIPFWGFRDLRTVVGFYPRSMYLDWKNNNPMGGTAHNALSDAKHQVKYMQHIIKELGVTELY